MKRAALVLDRGGAALACCLVALGLSGALPAYAGILGSLHDFSSKPISPQGSCSACHLSHGSPETLRWTRALDAERSYFNQDSSKDPDYTPDTTLLCYDCHDDNATTISPAVDDDPLKTVWSLTHEPQNIAFTDDTLAQGGTKTGYYELANGDVPGGPTPLPAAGSPTGGHYWKSEPSGTPDYQRGDKIPCSLCHDPHNTRTGSPANEAFFLSTTSFAGGGPVALGTGLTASNKDDATNPNRSRNGTGTGREMCSACHSYSNSGAPVTLGGVTLPKPPAGIAQHDSSSSTACTLCHAHNAPDCGTCHGSPPGPPPLSGAAAGYAGIVEASGPHPRHARKAPDGYGFACALCHSQFPTGHQNAAYQDVSFLATKNPSGAYVAGTRTCNNLYCHSRGARMNDTVNNLGAIGRAWTDAPDWSATALGCEACHGNNPARAEGLMNYGAPGYANGTVIDGSAKANSHAKHDAYPCARCHFNVVRDTDPSGGWTLFDVSLHANNTSQASFTFNVDPDPNFSAANFNSYSYAVAGGTCTVIDCHNGNGAQWGATLVCTDCHLRANAAGGDRDDWDGANGTAALIDSDQWSTGASVQATGHGRSAGWYPWPDNNGSVTPANLGCLTTDGTGDTPVGGCHAAKVPHGLATNPFRLATPNNITFGFENPSGVINGDSVNLFCQTCHASVLEQMHSKAITGDWGPLPLDWGAINDVQSGTPIAFKCTDCHDPHGDSPDYMIHAQVFAESSNNYGVPVQNPPSTGLGIQPTGAQVIDFDVTTPTQAQADYVDTGAGSTLKICQVCHQSNDYFRRTTSVAHNAGVECMQCHVHKEGFKPSACESCHNGVQTVYPLAPNVMGNGVSATGTGGATPKPYDDGSYGYNVNGHGRDDTPIVPGNAINVACTACHDIGQPVGKHLDGSLDGRTPSSGNANPFHLVAGFIGSPSTDWSAQVTFDDYCWNTCHSGRTSNHRHAQDSDPVVNAMQLGQHGSLGAPSNTPPPEMFYDVNITWLNTYNGGTNFGLCVTCHNPHGTNATSSLGDGNNKMVHYRWAGPATLCEKCH